MTSKRVWHQYLMAGIGTLAVPGLWWGLKHFCHISDRYLPSLTSVAQAWGEIEPPPLTHLSITAMRFSIGYVAGTLVGIAVGLAIFKWRYLRDLAMPALQSSRAVPAIAVIPFFLLWFGFSEVGRYLLVVAGTASNIAIAVLQILQQPEEKHRAVFAGFKMPPESLIFSYAIPIVAERLLPTLRFSLSMAMGLIVASELLGSQIGLGYLMQTARSTFSLNVIALAMILLGLLNVLADALLEYSWSKLIFWK
jgi:ABC-type nitrate/sulfonate/bicarbonate transport system permease component